MTLTIETLRQELAERCPGFIQVAAAALRCSPKELNDRAAAGALLANDLLIALAADRTATRRTVLGDLPIDVNTIDRLDQALKAATDRRLEVERRLAEQAHALAEANRVSRVLSTSSIHALAGRLHAMAIALDPEILERD